MLRLAGVLTVTVAHPAYRDLFPNGFNVPFNSAAGHVNRANGGGTVSSFGRDFRLAGYKWTKELCQQDSDGDGQTNGLELGDPCCHWKVGDEPLRTFDLGDPSIEKQSTGAGIPLNCTKLNQEIDPDFWNFYWKVTEAQSVVDGDIEAAKPISTAILVCLMCAWIYYGIWDDIKSLGVIRLGLIFLASFLWMDCLSGFLHITLDNPNLNSYPLIGGACRDFQEHHHNPGFLTRKHWLVFLQEVHVPVMVFCTWTLLRPRSKFLKNLVPFGSGWSSCYDGRTSIVSYRTFSHPIGSPICAKVWLVNFR